MNDTTVYVGLDVHKDTIIAAFLGPEPEAPVTDLGTPGSQQYTIDRGLIFVHVPAADQGQFHDIERAWQHQA